MWWKNNRWKVLAPVLIVAVLAAAFWYGGGAPGMQGWTARPDGPGAADSADLREPLGEAVSQTDQQAFSSQPEEEKGPDGTAGDGGEDNTRPSSPQEDHSSQNLGGASQNTGTGGFQEDPGPAMDRYHTDPVPEGMPPPAEPQETQLGETAYTCTLSISCAAILEHLDWLDQSKTELVPEDGWILEPTQVTFYEGESVFNVLQRTCKQEKIHMEFTDTPFYNSAYIEGIHNLYEFDCGDRSGWTYRVNGWFPNYGSSRYLLQDGDEVSWEYTCDLGTGVNGYSPAAD